MPIKTSIKPNIRPEQPSDYTAIYDMTKRAFAPMLLALKNIDPIVGFHPLFHCSE